MCLLAAADVHVARRLAELFAEPADGPVALAAALAVRAPRLGHVFVDLATIRETATVDTDEPVVISELPWPAPDGWTADVAGSPLAEGDGLGPLHLDGSRLYLDRYLAEERQIADDLIALAGGPAPAVDDALLGDGVRRIFGDEVYLAGTPDQVLESIRRYEAAGVTDLNVRVLGGRAPLEVGRRTLELFRDEIRPRLS